MLLGRHEPLIFSKLILSRIQKIFQQRKRGSKLQTKKGLQHQHAVTLVFSAPSTGLEPVTL
jgi:hypothetical protein